MGLLKGYAAVIAGGRRRPQVLLTLVTSRITERKTGAAVPEITIINVCLIEQKMRSLTESPCRWNWYVLNIRAIQNGPINQSSPLPKRLTACRSRRGVLK